MKTQYMKPEQTNSTCAKLLLNNYFGDLGEEDGRVPAVPGWRHAKHIDPVTQLQGDGHCKPAGAQPRVGLLPERQGHLLLGNK